MYLHGQHIAHLDLCLGNFVYDYKIDANGNIILPGYPYLIDLETSQELPLGPGRQPAIELTLSQYPKPGGLTHLDPYSWDMYCISQLSETVFEVRYIGHRTLRCTDTGPWKCIDSKLRSHGLWGGI